MKERLRNWLPVLPLLLLLAATYWLNQQVKSSAGAPNNMMRHDPDYIMENFTATTLDKNGNVSLIMSAQKMLHYPDDDSTLLETPYILSVSAERPQIRMLANRGEISRNGDEIILRDNVNIVRPATGKQSEMSFKSNHLRVQPDKDLADTKQPVTLTDARTKLNAVGMELNYKTHVVKFLSRVKSIYEPLQK